MNNEIFNQKYHKISRSQLRSQMTKAEIILWYRIRNNQLGCKFRRQHGIGKYVVDFYCPELKLIIEVDGDVHFYEKNIVADKEREAYFKGLELRIIRYTNLDVIQNIDSVLADLKKTIGM
ncbi:MAG: DNA methyltransferase [Candidatus Moranbacteria bacterium CG23_combo_of_CG06-09_8_20_14_all_40_16]|nr:MAG: DNA methyltransferase [Candidatus Moranbacteria bacterium CG23_combo_of_CG06-09_8_20_14_all_40_16]